MLYLPRSLEPVLRRAAREFPAVLFWRTAAGREVDLLVDTGRVLVPVEIKVAATPRPEMAAGIQAFRGDLGDRAGKGYVVYPGTERLPLGPDAVAWPLAEL